MSWREQAIARSLDSARTRANSRVQRFLDAARELMDHGGGEEFTVQEVVERSGQSLRSFYQYFGGKHELLLALLEEEVHAAADHLRAKVAADDDTVERLHRFVVEYHVLCAPAPKGSNAEPGFPPVLIEFAQQLLTAHPAEANMAFLPVVALFEQLYDDSVDTGAIRSQLPVRRLAGVVLQSILFNAFAATIAGSSAEDGSLDAAEAFWDVLLNGIGTGLPELAEPRSR